MKKTYQYLALAIGTIMFPLNGTCQATQPASTQERDEITAKWSLPNAKEVYRTILANIPPDDPEIRDAFLAEVWQGKRNQIVEAMQNSREYSEIITAKLEKLRDWNDESPELEDAKYAVQTYIQNQNGLFFRGDKGSQYEQQMRTARSNFARLQIALPREHNLQKLFDSFNQIGIGCPGCALTWDLIMDIVRLASNRLVDNPSDRQALEALDKLLNAITAITGNAKYFGTLAHDISGLPKVATEIVQTMRTMSTQLRSEFTPKDISSLLNILNQRTDFTPFQKPKLRAKLSEVSNAHPTGISATELKAILLKIVNDEGKIDSLLNSINRELSAVSTTIDEEKGFGGRLSVFSGEKSSTESQPSGISKKRAMLNEQERTNTKSAMQFFQQRVKAD